MVGVSVRRVQRVTLTVDFRDFLGPANKCPVLFSVFSSQLAYHISRVEKRAAKNLKSLSSRNFVDISNAI